MEAEEKRLMAAIIIAGIAGLALWNVWAHVFLIACGKAGIESWPWLVRGLVSAAGLA